MTKPIEGWVEVDEDNEIKKWLLNEDYCTGKVRQGEAPQQYVEVLLGTPESVLGLNFRPVRITFTDEYEAVTKYKRLDPVRNDQCDKQVAEALREERERIMDRFNELYPNAGSVLSDVIFGEEK